MGQAGLFLALFEVPLRLSARFYIEGCGPVSGYEGSDLERTLL